MAFSENEYHPGSYDIRTYLHDWLGMKIERR